MSDRYRYYLTEGDSPEREVTKAQFVSAERRAGFVNTMREPAEPATAAFSGPVAGIPTSGRVEFTGGDGPEQIMVEAGQRRRAEPEAGQ